MGLQTLVQALNRQHYEPQRGDWKTDAQLQEAVTNANNANASPRLRIKALNILNRHFQ